MINIINELKLPLVVGFIKKIFFFCLLLIAQNLYSQKKDSLNTKLESNQYIPFQENLNNIRYETALQKMDDSLKTVLKSKWVVGIKFGQFYIPNNLRTGLDSLTGTDISANKTQWTLYAEYFKSEKFSIGFDMSFNSVKQVLNTTISRSFSGGGGMNISFLINGKYIWNKQNHFLSTSSNQLMSNTPLDKNNKNEKIKFYNSFGAGITQSMVIKANGSAGSIVKNSYYQVVPTLFFGCGIFSRISRNILIDFGSKYILSKSYNPSIGSVKAYTGFNFQLSFGYIINNGYSEAKNNLLQKFVN